MTYSPESRDNWEAALEERRAITDFISDIATYYDGFVHPLTPSHLRTLAQRIRKGDHHV